VRTVYATQFDVEPTKSTDDLFQRLLGATDDWVKRWYERRRMDIAVPVGGGILEPDDGHRVEVTDARGAGAERLWSITWTYPADDDRAVLWQSVCTVGVANGRVGFSLVIRLGSSEFKVAPPSFQLRRPRLVKNVVDAFACTLGGRSVSSSPRFVGVDDVEAFVEMLRSPARRLPIVLVSADPFSEEFLVDPRDLADELVGVAEVHAFKDKWASFRLTRAIGNALACFNGAIRTYWPSVSKEVIRSGRLLLPDEVRQRRDDVAQTLLFRVGGVAAFRFVETEPARAARAAIDAARSSQFAALREEVASASAERAAHTKELESLLDEVSRLERENARLATERDDAHLRAMELEETNRQLQDNIAIIGRHMPAAVTSIVSSVEAAPIPDPDSVIEALDLAAERLGDALVVWDSARASASRSDYDRPGEVYDALLALHEVARTYFATRDAGRPMGPWDQAFAQRGFRYAHTESQTTMTQYGKEREFTHQGRRLRMVKHLTLGGGDKRNCLQIYFEVDEEARRFLIGHCGRHLSTDKYH
jgi:hypothetical protein